MGGRQAYQVLQTALRTANSDRSEEPGARRAVSLPLVNLLFAVAFATGNFANAKAWRDAIAAQGMEAHAAMAHRVLYQVRDPAGVGRRWPGLTGLPHAPSFSPAAAC